MSFVSDLSGVGGGKSCGTNGKMAWNLRKQRQKSTWCWGQIPNIQASREACCVSVEGWGGLCVCFWTCVHVFTSVFLCVCVCVSFPMFIPIPTQDMSLSEPLALWHVCAVLCHSPALLLVWHLFPHSSTDEMAKRSPTWHEQWCHLLFRVCWEC